MTGLNCGPCDSVSPNWRVWIAADTALAGIRLTLFLRRRQREEISARWLCLKKINRSRDSWFVLRSLQAGFRACSAIMDRFVIVSFFLEKQYIAQYHRWLTCYVCARLCQCFGKGGCYFGCDKPCTCSYNLHEHNVFCYSAVAHISTPSVNLTFGPKSGFKNKCRPRAGFGLVISASGRVQASKWGPFTTLRG